MRTPYVERDCVFNGVEAHGAIVTDEYIVAYPRADGALTDWHGNAIGTYTIASRWPVRSAFGTHMCQIYALVNGVRYTGRGFGAGMIFKGRRVRSRR